jgi:hypothetical protein
MTSIINMLGTGDYEVQTDLPAWAINQISLEIFRMWVSFAEGGEPLGGRKIAYPTGRYASSIRSQTMGVATVAIMADENIAPEAAWIESGHKPYDMKKALMRGRGYPMHRPPGEGNFGTRRLGYTGPISRRRTMWAAARSSEFSGFASIGPNSPADSWIIPEMPAYSPALNLAIAAANIADGMQT